MIACTASITEEAGRPDPAALRSLNAIHLTATLGLRDELEGIVTYDDRMASAAAVTGIPVAAPA